MSEQGSERPAAAVVSDLWRKIALWAGCVVGLGLLGIVLLYFAGDPRPANVDAAEIGGGPGPLPKIAVGDDYYRLRAEYIPLPPAAGTPDPVGRAWAALFGSGVGRAGAATVSLLLSYPGETSPRMLLETPSDGSAKSSVTGFSVRQPGASPRVRLDVKRRGEDGGGLLPTLHIAMSGEEVPSSGWISVFADASPTAGGTLNHDNALQPVRDYKARAVGAVRIGLEARKSLVFGEAFSGTRVENEAISDFLDRHQTSEARRLAVLSMVEANLPPDFGGEAHRDDLESEINRVFASVEGTSGAAGCAANFARLRTEFGLSSTDAALIAFLARLPESGDAAVCEEGAAGATLAALGVPAAARSVLARRTAEKARETEAAKEGAAAVRAASEPAGRYVCIGVSGERIRALCQVLNDIAGEWRSGVKFLNMEASRRHILDDVGLEEPTLEMDYGSIRIKNRRDLLIHVALSDIENFACFRMTRQNPAYFEALIVLRDGSKKGPWRVDVFEFAFSEAGKIARIRRRAAVSGDIDEARSLPASSRCRQEFVARKEAALRRIIRRQWQLPATSG